jgi:L-seryl-tRNA(Ser) seleniumtransferase
VLNGTGIVIHTNLGRAPLGEEALEAVAVAARGYSTLEFDLEAGRRGSRHHLVTELLTALTGAEDALVANNNAAAVLLALGALAKRKRVVVSRGQLVEIGGSFRIPDICKASGAKLVEVGTTNRTRLSDFEQAVDERTGALLRVHPSNFRVVGFTEEVSLAELVELGRQRRIPVVDDLGSGALAEPGAGLEREPLAGESVAAGADVVTFSGDKLLGGPQAGIAVGRRKVIERMRRNPLMRAVRPGKLTLAALDATLRAYLRPEGPGELPVHRMLGIGVEALEEWGRPLLEAWEQPAEAAGLELAIVPSVARSGGGSLPGEELPSRALAFSGSGRALAALQRSLRLARPAVIGYLTEGRLHLDLRTLVLEDRARLEGVVADVLRERER